MLYRTLGRTGLRVSLLGVGTGGPSNFGQATGVPEADIHRLVRRALDVGVNIFDTAAGYRESEAILGRALKGVSRDHYYLATKFTPEHDNQVVSPEEVVASVERSLTHLRTEYVEVLQFHGVRPRHYREVVDRLLPTVLKLQEQGKCRWIGITEQYGEDGAHEMLQMALADNHFDTAMVGYNMLNQSADHLVYPQCLEHNVGVFIMFAVRRVLASNERLEQTIADLKQRGLVAADAVPERQPLDWLIHGNVDSIPSAAYKYTAMHAATSTVLSGTANLEHFETNLRALADPVLPAPDYARLRQLFGKVVDPIGN
jgi:L-galactose dehydrogenase